MNSLLSLHLILFYSYLLCGSVLSILNNLIIYPNFKVSSFIFA